MMIMTRRLVLAAALIGLVAGATGRARASLVLDQSYVAPGTVFDAAVATNFDVAQSITAGLAGQLAQVDLLIAQSPGTTGNDVVLTIRSLVGGVPANSLFQTTIPLATIPVGPGFPSLTSVDVSAADIMLLPGDQFVIDLSRTAPGSPPWVLWRSPGNGYAGGTAFTGTPGAWTALPQYDYVFQTYVETAAVPEPSSLAMAGLMTLAGLGYGWRSMRATVA